MPQLRSRIMGTGLGIPSRVVTNFDLEKIVETSDEWIQTRTGIRERRLVDPEKGETLSSLSTIAAIQALERAKISPEQVDLVLCCTTTPDTVLPISAARIQAAMGAPQAGAMDINAACSGFVTGLHVADGLLRGGLHKTIVVVGADVFSAILDWKDRSTCVLFGDASGAAVLQSFEAQDTSLHSKESMILGSRLYCDFDENEALAVKGGGSRTPPHDPRFGKEHKPFVTMMGQDVFKAGTRAMAHAGKDVVERCGLTMDDIDWFVPHQANIRIIEMVGKLLNFPMEKTYVNVDRWGNSSAGTVAVCLAEMERKGLLKKGQLVLLDVFGGGFTYGAMVVRW